MPWNRITKNEVHSIKFAISWSGACHDGIGVFKGWFDEYYQEALENGYAKIPMFWRENLLLSKNVLMPNESKANDVIEQTIQWINKVLMMNR